jgi:hypothetical protein
MVASAAATVASLLGCWACYEGVAAADRPLAYITAVAIEPDAAP